MPENFRSKFGAPARTVLLVEVERYCTQPHCLHLNRVGLTKTDARIYDGFVCERCERHNPDRLTERDIPEWWKEISVSS